MKSGASAAAAFELKAVIDLRHPTASVASQLAPVLCCETPTPGSDMRLHPLADALVSWSQLKFTPTFLVASFSGRLSLPNTGSRLPQHTRNSG